MSDSPCSAPRPLRLLPLSFAWAGLGLLLALDLPWIERHDGPDPGNFVPLTLSGLFAVANLLFAVRLVGRTGRVQQALPFIVALVTLFGVLFVQVGCHLGMGCYRWDRLPRWWEWAALPLVGALRAADVLNLLDAFDIPLETIHPGHVATLALFAAYHLILRLFFIGLFAQAVRGAVTGVRGLLKSMPAGMRSGFYLPLTFVSLGVATILFTAGLAAWGDLQGTGATPGTDLLVRLGDQTLRTLDVTDLVPVLGAENPRPPSSGWVWGIGLLVRLILLVWLVRGLGRLGLHLSLRLGGGFGLGAGGLEAIRRHDPNRSLRVLAGKHLFAVSLKEPPRLRGTWATATAGLLALLALSATLSGWPGEAGHRAIALRLAGLGITASDPAAARALSSIRRLGPYASAAVPVLGAGLSSVKEDRQRLLIDALGDLGPEAIPVLAGCVAHRPSLAPAAIPALARIGPAAVPALIQALESPGPEIRLLGREALCEMGRRAAPGLLAHLDRASAPFLVPLLERVDPLWYLRDPGRQPAREVRTARMALALLLEGERRSQKDDLPPRGNPIDPVLMAPQLLDLGPRTAEAIPILVARLADDRTSYGASELLRGIEQTGPHGRRAVPALVRLLSRGQPPATLIRATLDRIDPGWRGVARSLPAP